MNVTLSIDAKLVEQARRLAAAQGTSLNQMIRRLVEEATAASSVDRLAEELDKLWDTWRRRDQGLFAPCSFCSFLLTVRMATPTTPFESVDASSSIS